MIIYKASMIIHGEGGAGLCGAVIETYEDHRMAMSMAVAGLRVPVGADNRRRVRGQVISRLLGPVSTAQF